jgi:predicted unusual protein kinase regulating ubiquinone biosynthesis (AarF/ABC1/UbiB family)
MEADMPEPDDSPRMPGGRIGRVAPLVGMAGRTAGDAVVASLRNRRRSELDAQRARVEFHTRTAGHWAQRLGRSRGVLMKAGQIVSVVLPEAGVDAPYRGIYQAAFAKLQDDAPPMPASVVTRTLTEELGRPPGEVFAQFDPRPIAAASIGQVHAATLPDGRRVAVKVQYPGVEQAIRADLANTELLATFLRLLLSVAPNMTRMDVRAMASEISDRIGEEIDYRVEAANQREFTQGYQGHPFIRIPEVYDELSTRRVLTMQYVDGLRYTKAVRAEQQLRDRWAEAIYRFVLDSLYRLGIGNTDLHPGNFLFHPDGGVSFLDFGSVKRLATTSLATVVGFLDRTVDQDADELHRWALQSGWLHSPNAASPEQLLGWWSEAYRYLLPPQPLTMTPQYAATVLRERSSPTGPHNRVLRALDMPADYILAGRMDVGMIAALGGLGATADWDAIRREYHHRAPATTAFGERDAAFRAGRR